MHDVIDLAARREERRLIWVCACGCTSHRHYADGEVACAACETVCRQDSGEWRERLPELPAEVKPLDGDNFKVTQIGGAEVWLRRWLKRAGEAALLVFVDAEGGASTWAADVATDEQRAWVERHMAAATRRITARAT